MSRMECSITDGPKPDDEQIIPEPDPDEMRHEPEDNFSLSVRLRMMINRISNGDGFTIRQLVELLKDAKQMADSHTQLCSKVDDTADKLRESLIGRPQG